MKRQIVTIIAALVVLQACKKDKQDNAVQGRFEILAAQSTVNGNLVMGQATDAANTVVLAFKNTPAGAPATISADTINGLYIKPVTVTLTGDSAKVSLSGTPVIDGVFLLSAKVKLNGATYVCTKEFYVDIPNVSAIASTLPADTTVNNVVDSSKLSFQVNPYTTVFALGVPAHLTAQITNTSREGRVLTLYADNQFVGGDVVVTSTFRSLTPLVNTIHVNAFAGGDGTAAKPLQVPDTARLSRIQYAPGKAYQLTANINAPRPTLNTVTLTGSIDGNGKTISGFVLSSTATNTGFIGTIAAGASVKDLTLTGIAVTGGDYTGGLAGVNNGTITNVTVAGNITGSNFAAGIAGNNVGTISSCDASNANVTGVNNIATLAGNTNSGSSEAGNVLLFTGGSFPMEVYGLASAQAVPFAFTPTTGTITVKAAPSGVTSSVAGQTVTLTPPPGFISGNLQLGLQAGKLSLTRNVMLYSKTKGAVFDGGDGSVASPFIISSEPAFDSIILAPAKNYQLAADITLSKTWVSIPAFSGSLDGKGFAVSGLVINAATPNAGLTGTLTGTIKNIRFLNVNASTTASGFGIVAGILNAGTLQNVAVGGTLTSTSAADTLGGLVGTLNNGGKLTQAYAKLTITAACGMVGGLVGCLTTGTPASEISFSTTAGSIEITASKSRVGGILGRGAGSVVSGGILKNCLSSMDIKSSGTVTGANGFGGIFGADQNAGIVPIDQCMFTGTVSAGFSIGGIAGVGSTISNCLLAGQGAGLTTSTLLCGSATSVGSVGGIAGTDKVSLQYCLVKNATLRGSTTAAFPLGGIASTYQNSGYTSKSVVVNTSIDGGVNSTRVTGTTGAHSSNYVGPNVTTPNRTAPFVDDATGVDGMFQASMPFSFFTGLGFSAAIWKTDTDGYPTLINAGYNGGYTLP